MIRVTVWLDIDAESVSEARDAATSMLRIASGLAVLEDAELDEWGVASAEVAP